MAASAAESNGKSSRLENRARRIIGIDTPNRAL